MLLTSVGSVRAIEPCAPFETRVAPELLAEMRDAAHQDRLYRVIPGQARVEFCIRHFPFQEFRGTFTHIIGGLALPAALDRQGRALLLVRTTTMEANEPDLASLVQGNEFMDIKRFPEILFVGRDFEWYSPTRARIFGDLTLHGITRPVAFDVGIRVLDVDANEQPTTLELVGTSQVSRLDFDIRSRQFLVSETVRLCLSVDLRRWEE